MPLDYNKLNSFIPLSPAAFIQLYRVNPLNSPAAQYYAELAKEAQPSWPHLRFAPSPKFRRPDCCQG